MTWRPVQLFLTSKAIDCFALNAFNELQVNAELVEMNVTTFIQYPSMRIERTVLSDGTKMSLVYKRTRTQDHVLNSARGRLQRAGSRKKVSC